MKQTSLFVVLTLFIIGYSSCQTTEKSTQAVFEYFEYRGMDTRFEKEIDNRNEYFNPIISGFYPDPSICRKGEDYFLVCSSFSYFPGIPIFHSTDLVNWTQIGHVLNRPSQLNLDGIRLSGGIYAPAIEYNEYNDTFYLITTCVDGIGNFIVKTDDPFSNTWSEPIPLPKVGGIDPSLFFDDDGKAYIVHNDAPEGTPEWDGHRAIWIHNFDTETDSTFGEKQVLIDGGVDRSAKPVWIEGPHIYKIGGRYYLMAAEGGTSVNHSEVILSAENIKGPYIPYRNNPILTQRDLPEPRQDIVTSVGHADLIQTAEGDWYAVFLGCRSYEDNHYNTGRETFLLPVKWENNYPVILDKNLAVSTVVRKENLEPNDTNYLTGNFTWRDDFDKRILNDEWLFIRTPRDEWWMMADGKLVLKPTDRSIYEINNPVFIGRRQQHLIFEAETELSFNPTTENAIAGLVCYQNESHNFVLGKTMVDGQSVIVLNRSEKTTQRIAELIVPDEYVQSPVKLKVKGRNDKYSFYVSFNNGIDWEIIEEDVDAKNLSTETAGGFTGVILGMYTSLSN